MKDTYPQQKQLEKLEAELLRISASIESIKNQLIVVTNLVNRPYVQPVNAVPKFQMQPDGSMGYLIEGKK